MKNIINENENNELVEYYEYNEQESGEDCEDNEHDSDEDYEDNFILESKNVNENINSGAKICTTKSICKNCVLCRFKVLIKYNLHSMPYSHLFLAYKFILTLLCTQVCCETSFSKLKYLLNGLPSCLFQEKIETFLLINVEKYILSNIKNEDVIQLITEKNKNIIK